MNLFKKKKNDVGNQDEIQEKSLKKYSKLKLSDKISLKMRKRIFVSNIFTTFIVIDLIVAFIGINLIVDSLDIESIDVTANKIYTLSEESKEVIKDINQDVKIYVYGVEEEGNTLLDFLGQYNDTNERITYEIITEENNLEKVKEFELESGNVNIIVESGESRKILSSDEFYTYDYTTGSTVDLTEEVLTNAILAMIAENQPKVYFLTGHNEYDTTQGIAYLASYLKYESMEYDSINLLTSGSVPEDCTALAIISPVSDIYDSEVQAIIDYINKGGNLFIAQDILSEDVTFTNLQKILDIYGVTIANSILKENSASYSIQGSSNIFIPQASANSAITADIASSNQGMILAYARKLDFVSDEEMEALNVTKEDLLTTTETAQYADGISNNAQYGEQGQYVVASMLTKTFETENSTEETSTENESSTEENVEEEEKLTSKLVVVGNAVFLSDYAVSQIGSYPMLLIGNNKDFALNALEMIGEKEAQLTIRKDMLTSSYAYSATVTQRVIVIISILILPILIIIAGIIVGVYRKKRK